MDFVRIGISQQWRWRLEYAAARAVIGIVQLLSPRQCASLAKGLSWLLADVFKVRRRVVEENLTAVFPTASPEQIRAATREMWYHLVMMGCEVVLAPRKIHDTNWRNYVNIRDKRLMTSYLIDFRPLVFVSGHYGNFEMGGYATGLLGFSSHTVARTLDNPYLDKFINNFRATNGQFILPKDGSAMAVQKVLDEGGIIAILGDQHAGTKGCWVDFLGRPAACHKAVALFTLESNAPMMVSYCRHTDKPFYFEVGCTGIADPLELPDELRDVKSLTQWYNDRMAKAIALSPAQYWWLHRRWKEKPVRQTKKVREAA